MTLTREEREELRRRVDEESRRRLRSSYGTLSLAKACYEQANGDPLLALLLAIRFVQLHPEYLEEAKRRLAAAEEKKRERKPPRRKPTRKERDPERNEAIRAMRREGHTLREIGERFGLSVAAVAYITRPWD